MAHEQFARGIMAPVSRIHAYCVCALSIGAVLSPVLRDPEDDGFPLSTYPMFARPRAPTTTIHAAVAIASDGARTPIPPALLGTHETMQAVRILSRSLRAGPDGAQQLCSAVAARLARSADEAFHDAQQVAIISQELDVLSYAQGVRDVSGVHTHAQCPIARSAP